MDRGRNGAERKCEPLKIVIRKSVGLPPVPEGVGELEEPAIVETNNMAIEVSNLKQQITDITNGLKRIDRTVNSEAAKRHRYFGPSL